MTIEYRIPTAADAEALCTMARAAFTATFGHFYRPVDLATFLDAKFGPSGLAAQVDDPRFDIRIACEAGRIVGFAKLGPVTLPPPAPREAAIELHQLYVLAAHQGTGVAAALMDWALATARAQEKNALCLGVYAGNVRAQRFYARYGLVEIGRYDFPVGEHIDDERIWLLRLESPLPLRGGESRPMTLPIPITSAALAGVRHGFLGRRGGVSTGIYAGLNVGLGSDDDRAAILENRRRAIAAVAPGTALTTLHQVHSPDAVAVAAPFPDDARPHADALVTDRPGLALGILTADCVPILLNDADAGVIGAAHAGWKGALGGVVAATLAEMERLGARPERVAAAIGPCIGRASYEVDDAFLASFAADDPANERFFQGGRGGHHQFDIEGYVVARLAAAGVRRIDALGLDTYADEDRFFSYRRATHRGEPGYGRQIALIALS